MLFINKKLASTIENCIKQTHIEVTKRYQAGHYLEISHGAACFSGVDSYLSQVVGWGFHSEVRHFKQELETIEGFYRALGHQRVDIEICPYVGNELVVFLSQNGYQVTELNNVSVLDLTTYSYAEPVLDVLYPIKQVEAGQLRDWAKQVAIGFHCPDASTQFFYYASAKGSQAFAVFDKDKIVAGAVIAMHQGICDLGVTSTVATYRNKGFQKRLLDARLQFAKQAGLSVAVVTTEPGSVSDLNVQKVGFYCAYTRMKVTKSGIF
jgi:GNAT superfamily N-acetyltransferase